jgi:putative hydrolase of the HAD superfamily
VDAAERARIPRSGYGEQKFLHTLEEVYLKLAGNHPDRRVVEEIARLARHLHEAPLRLLDGVVDTLAYLAPRHRLFLFSKGDGEEQTRKVKESGVAQFFEHWEMVARDGWILKEVWMVGDSPRSDINPALSVGLNAVHIPADHRWEFEEEEIRPGPGQLLILDSFRQLQDHF